MADESTWGYGTTLAYAPLGGSSWTTITKIVEIDAKKIKRAPIKVTTLDSPNRTDEFRPGMVQVEPFTAKMIWKKTQHHTLLEMCKAADPTRDFRITLSDGTTIAGTGWISGISEIPKASNEEVYMDDVEFHPSGAWVETPAT